MLEYINSQEILTKQEAKNKYSTKYFKYIPVHLDMCQQDKTTVRVIYIADREHELNDTPRKAESGEIMSRSWGSKIKQEGLRIGVIVKDGGT